LSAITPAPASSKSVERVRAHADPPAARRRALLLGPDEIRNLFDAFEATLTKLGLKKDREDTATMLVARAIIDAAKRGERDPIRLCEAAIEALSGQGRDLQ
jgi:hypothetical protein